MVGALLAAGAGFFVWQDVTAPAAPEPGATSRSSRHRRRAAASRLPLRGHEDADAEESTDDEAAADGDEPTDAKEVEA